MQVAWAHDITVGLRRGVRHKQRFQSTFTMLSELGHWIANRSPNGAHTRGLCIRAVHSDPTLVAKHAS